MPERLETATSSTPGPGSTATIWGQRFQLLTDEGRREATLKTRTTNDFKDLQAFASTSPRILTPR